MQKKLVLIINRNKHSIRQTGFSPCSSIFITTYCVLHNSSESKARLVNVTAGVPAQQRRTRGWAGHPAPTGTSSSRAERRFCRTTAEADPAPVLQKQTARASVLHLLISRNQAKYLARYTRM